jgi:hypothetical protein
MLVSSAPLLLRLIVKLQVHLLPLLIVKLQVQSLLRLIVKLQVQYKTATWQKRKQPIRVTIYLFQCISPDEPKNRLMKL